MRSKPLPRPPESFGYVETAHRAVPLVPGSEEDCCSRLAGRLETDREHARQWLTFLQTLGLARETERGFARNRREVERGALADTFREGQFGAREVLAALADADGPLAPAEVFARFEPHVPMWERHRNPETWRDIWTDRVGYLLEWAVLFGLAERTDGGYRPAESTSI